MARKRHHKKHTRRRHKKHGLGSVSGMATEALALIAGGVAARFVSNTVANAMTTSGSAVTQNTKYIAGAAPIVAGFLLPKFISSSFGKGLGAGMIAVGGLSLAQTFGLPGIAGVPMVAGYGKRVGLGPTNMNSRGVVAGLSTHQAAVMVS